MLNQKRVLVVEDDPTLYPILTRMFHRLNSKIDVEFALSAEGAEDLLLGLDQKYDVVVSDIGLAGKKTGSDLVNDVYFKGKAPPFVLTSGNRDYETRLPFLPKPIRYEDFAEKLSVYVGEDAVPAEVRTGQASIHGSKRRKKIELLTIGALLAFALTFYAVLTTQIEHLPLSGW
jgi:DNA-binding NtrC family response regulator